MLIIIITSIRSVLIQLSDAFAKVLPGAVHTIDVKTSITFLYLCHIFTFLTFFSNVFKINKLYINSV